MDISAHNEGMDGVLQEGVGATIHLIKPVRTVDFEQSDATLIIRRISWFSGLEKDLSDVRFKA